jgi:hypothetical protein
VTRIKFNYEPLTFAIFKQFLNLENKPLIKQIYNYFTTVTSKFDSNLNKIKHAITTEKNDLRAKLSIDCIKIINLQFYIYRSVR